jgi:hypothetical protein
VPAPGAAAPPAPPVETPPADIASLVPEEIVFVPGDPASSFAVIAGRAVRRGDRIGGRLVHEVTEHAVRLGDEGEIVLPKGR